MKQLVTGLAGLAVVATTVVLLAGTGASQAAQDPADAARAQQLQPVAVCEARQVGRDVEVVVQLRLTDDRLAVSRDRALVVADLGDVTQTRMLRPDERDADRYSVTFQDLPDGVTARSFSLRASRSPDDPASIPCDSSAAAGPAAPTDDTARGSLPRSGG